MIESIHPLTQRLFMQLDCQLDISHSTGNLRIEDSATHSVRIEFSNWVVFRQFLRLRKNSLFKKALKASLVGMKKNNLTVQTFVKGRRLLTLDQSLKGRFNQFIVRQFVK
jgi:hypothetical protein